METLLKDLRYAGRMLLKTPALSAVVILTLALGIGANSTVFSIVNAILIRPLPYDQPDRLVMLWNTFPKKGWDHTDVSPLNFINYREQNKVFEQIGAFRTQELNLTGEGEPERVEGSEVTAAIFPLLRKQPIKGRTFRDEEEQPGKNNVAILGYGLWARRFGASDSAIGKTIMLNGQPNQVVGVMSKEVAFPRRAEIWVPLSIEAIPENRRGANFLQVIARLKPGTTIEQASAEMSTLAERLAQAYPATNADSGVRLVTLPDELLGPFRAALFLLLGAVGFVLLIACVNVANLLLARAVVRQREIAVRVALGAGRWRLIRQLLTESILLALIGGVAGLLVAYVGTSIIVGAIPEELARLVGLRDVTIDVRVLLFTLVMSLLTGIVFGLAPALQVSKPDLNEALKEGARGSSSGVIRTRLRKLLVAFELALALVLITGASLMAQSFLRLLKVNPGFTPDNVLTMRLWLPSSATEPQRQVVLNRELLQRIQNTPQVEAAGTVNNLPLSGSGNNTGLAASGVGPDHDYNADFNVVSPDYFRAMNVPLLKGRTFSTQDSFGSNKVAVVSQTLAQHVWPNAEAIGQQVKVGESSSWRTVVGVVGDVKHWRLADPPNFAVYVPYQQEPGSAMFLVVRSSAAPRNLVPVLKDAVRSVDNEQTLSEVRTMNEVVADTIAPLRLFTLLLGIFAAVALVLAAVGIYGLVSNSVAQRTQEIGVRMALGAQPSDILRLVIRQGMLPVVIGLGIGLIAAILLTRFMSSLLYGVNAGDTVTLTTSVLLFAVIALIACFVPARRAVKLDPVTALRHE